MVGHSFQGSPAKVLAEIPETSKVPIAPMNMFAFIQPHDNKTFLISQIIMFFRKYFLQLKTRQ